MCCTRWLVTLPVTVAICQCDRAFLVYSPTVMKRRVRVRRCILNHLVHRVPSFVYSDSLCRSHNHFACFLLCLKYGPSLLEKLRYLGHTEYTWTRTLCHASTSPGLGGGWYGQMYASLDNDPHSRFASHAASSMWVPPPLTISLSVFTLRKSLHRWNAWRSPLAIWVPCVFATSSIRRESCSRHIIR